MDDFEHTQITLNVDGQPVNLHFLFLENGDLTAAFIKGYKFKHVDQRDQARRRVPVNGMAARNPKDEPDQDYAMRVATWRACHNIDGDYDYYNQNNGHDGFSLGPVGAKIYRAFREWQFEKNNGYTAWSKAPFTQRFIRIFKAWLFEKNNPKEGKVDEPENSNP